MLATEPLYYRARYYDPNTGRFISEDPTGFFPICDTPDEFRNGRNGVRRISSLSPGVRAVIERLQPYNRGHSMMRPALSILRELVNTDKHKLLRLAYSTITEGKFSLVGYQPPGIHAVTQVGDFGEIKDGTEIAAITFSGPNPGMKFQDIEFELVIALWHGKRDASVPDWAGRTEFSALLNFIFGEVDHVISEVSTAAKGPCSARSEI
jgi:hypothetical protein